MAVHFQSSSRTIGDHDWRLIVADFEHLDGKLGVEYEFRAGGDDTAKWRSQAWWKGCLPLEMGELYREHSNSVAQALHPDDYPMLPGIVGT